MKIELNGKEYNIKFGYKPTLKERIISKVVKLGDVTGENDEVDMEKVEDLLLFLPELLLVGLQVNHNDFRYDYDTKGWISPVLDIIFTHWREIPKPPKE